jgi:hypothetical protein
MIPAESFSRNRRSGGEFCAGYELDSRYTPSMVGTDRKWEMVPSGSGDQRLVR